MANASGRALFGATLRTIEAQYKFVLASNMSDSGQTYAQVGGRGRCSNRTV